MLNDFISKDDPFLVNALIVITFICLVALVLLLVGIILNEINSAFGPVNNGVGTVIEKRFEKSHYSTTLIYSAATKSFMPITTWHDDAWKVTLKDESGEYEDDIYLDADEYDKVKVNKTYPIEFKTGCLWKTFSLKSIKI